MSTGAFLLSLLASDLARAALCRQSYDESRAPRWQTPGLCHAFLDRDPDGTAIVTFRGTVIKDAGDWWTDLRQLPMHLDPAFGPLPGGFGSAVLSVLLRIFRELDGRTVVGFNGHSMGGANALIAAALWKHSGGNLGRVTAFEPPHVGRLGGLLENEEVLATRVGIDPVPEVPILPPFHCHPVPITVLPNLARWSAIGCHEIANVILALTAALAAPAAA